MQSELVITETFTPKEEQAMQRRLQAHNINSIGPAGRDDLAILLRDDSGEPEGGLIAHTGRGWLYVRMLYVPEHRRGQGLATCLMSRAENEARARGCLGAYLDTSNPGAASFYAKQGYQVLGQLNDGEDGQPVTWMKKRL